MSCLLNITRKRKGTIFEMRLNTGNFFKFDDVSYVWPLIPFHPLNHRKCWLRSRGICISLREIGGGDGSWGGGGVRDDTKHVIFTLLFLALRNIYLLFFPSIDKYTVGLGNGKPLHHVGFQGFNSHHAQV
jgi:hypothetical protein